MKRNQLVIGLMLLVLAVGACSRNRAVVPKVDMELLTLSKEEAFARAEALFEEKKWTRARRYYSHVYENYPNDPLGRRSLLKVADTYFHQGSPVNLIEAQYKYRDFINRYPGADSADYAMLQIGMVSFKQMERPDRDQTKTKEAVEKLSQMIAAYPNSSYRTEAQDRLQQALDRLAKHDHIVARFYMKRGNFKAAIDRLNGIVDQYPGYVDRSETFFDLAISLERSGRKGEARLYYERVMAEFPESSSARKAKQKLEDFQA
ncbi:MAG TPA: outer membrane protein assembly factor BamD [Thermoanaerobaculia bacterium]|nr:outer membrane protein assembly factor BamD [Thermoanaerobaculia bacterium]